MKNACNILRGLKQYLMAIMYTYDTANREGRLGTFIPDSGPKATLHGSSAITSHSDILWTWQTNRYSFDPLMLFISTAFDHLTGHSFQSWFTSAQVFGTSSMALDHLREWQKAQKGELYHAFVPELVAARDKCSAACNAFNDNRDPSRRTVVKLWRA